MGDLDAYPANDAPPPATPWILKSPLRRRGLEPRPQRPHLLRGAVRGRFQGSGTIGGEPWVYDYTGYLVPVWPHGVDQTDAIVGSVVRTVAHSNGQAEAGCVASFIAVRNS